jgi:hypothetical protein
MNRLGFIETDEGESSSVRLLEILPSGGDDGEMLDDASLRVLMKRCREILRRDGNFENLYNESEERWRRAKQLDVLIEMLLFRSLEHTDTLFKDQTVSSYLTDELGITDKQLQIGFTKQTVAPDQLARISQSINQALSSPEWGKSVGFEEPLLFCAEKVAPKCFRGKVASEHVHEEFTWIADPIGEPTCIDEGIAAPTLSAMENSRQGNIGLRFYLIGRNLKAHPELVSAVEALVTENLREAYRDYQAWSQVDEIEQTEGNDP